MCTSFKKLETNQPADKYDVPYEVIEMQLNTKIITNSTTIITDSVPNEQSMSLQ